MENYAVECPRKIILYGEHAVVHGKLAIAVAIGMPVKLRVYFQPHVPDSFELNTFQHAKWIGGELRHLAEEISQMDELDPVRPKPPSMAVVRRLIETVGKFQDTPDTWDSARVVALHLWIQIFHPSKKAGSITVEVEPNTIWGGLGNSAAYSVVMATAMLLITGVIEAPLTSEAKKLINEWAYSCETILHGRPSGVDNTVCCFGGMIRFSKGKTLNPEAKVPNLRIMVVYSNQKRSTKILAERVGTLRTKHSGVLDAIFDAMDAVSRRASSIIDAMMKEPDQLDHHHTLEELVDINQGLLQSLGVSTPRLERICEIAREHGFHAKLTGAGGGGCAFVLLPPDVPEHKIQELGIALAENGFQHSEAQLGVPGLAVKPLD